MFNKVILLGRLTREPNEKRISTIAMDGGKNKDGEQHTDFVPFIVPEKLFNSIGQYLQKGKLVLIEGQLKSYKVTKEGKNYEQLIVAVRNIQLLGGKKKDDKGNSKGVDEGAPDDDIFD